MGLVYHLFSGHGLLSEHLEQLFGLAYSDSAASERRQALPWEVFARLMRAALRPLAQKQRHPEAFYRRWRLVAIDGTNFTANNAPAIKRARRKARSRRGRAAFLKIPAVVLLELGLHNPLAVAIGRQGESEWKLSVGLLSQLSSGCLLLADRLYGCGAMLAQVLDRCRQVKSEFLVRVRRQLKVQVRRRLKDGSRLIEVAVRQKGCAHRIERRLQWREIRVRVHRAGFRGQELRLWTSILNEQHAPALELARLYAQRWEQELYYRQLKLELRRSDRLQSQTLETVAQEIAAWILSSALIARERARAARGEVPVLRVSFAKLVELLRPLWLVLALGADLLQPKQVDQLTERFLRQARGCLTPKRRARSCPRAVRQPIKGWPRLLKNKSWESPVTLTLLTP
jgi:hypothetical protein